MSAIRPLARRLLGPRASRAAGRWVRRGRLALERGNARECPCCGGRFRRFRPFGTPLRPDVHCPRCGSLERHRLVWLAFERSPELLEGAPRLLHVAPEAALARRLLSVPGLRYLSADLAQPASLRLDLTLLPFQDGSFDALVCNHVLEHVGDDRAAMRELRRVLRPGGWALLQSPLDPTRAHTDEDPDAEPEERARRFGQADHLRLYGRDYPERLAAAGLSVDEWRWMEDLGPALGARYGLDPDESLFLCRR